MTNLKPYTPRRSARYLKGAPDHVLCLFLTKGGTWEVLYTGHMLLQRGEGARAFSNCIVPGREMDSDPSHPQGVGMYFELSAWEAMKYRASMRSYRVTWESLPEKVKARIIADGKI